MPTTPCSLRRRKYGARSASVAPVSGSPTERKTARTASPSLWRAGETASPIAVRSLSWKPSKLPDDSATTTSPGPAALATCFTSRSMSGRYVALVPARWRSSASFSGSNRSSLGILVGS